MTQHNAALGQPYFKFDPTGRTHINATLTPTIQRQTSLTTKPNGQCIRRIQNPDGKYRCEGFGHDLLQCEDLTLGLDIHTRIKQGTLVLLLKPERVEIMNNLVILDFFWIKNLEK